MFHSRPTTMAWLSKKRFELPSWQCRLSKAWDRNIGNRNDPRWPFFTSLKQMKCCKFYEKFYINTVLILKCLCFATKIIKIWAHFDWIFEEKKCLIGKETFFHLGIFYFTIQVNWMRSIRIHCTRAIPFVHATSVKLTKWSWIVKVQNGKRIHNTNLKRKKNKNL